MTLEATIRRIALDNALEHGGKANAHSVLGKLIAAEPSLRSKIGEVHQLVDEIVDSVNVMGTAEQRAELERLGKVEKPKKAAREGLPPLANAEKGVVVRFAPNPDGAIHLGNARPAVLSYAYAQMYNGRFILRFEDTDPKVKVPEKRFYRWIEEDLKWLGIRWDKKVIQSQRLKVYYDYAEQLIGMGGAYVCTCPPEAWRVLVKKSWPCSCRELSKDTQLERWQKMLEHRYKEGEAVVRIKTDLTHPNPAVRDWPALRIVDKPKHPLARSKHVWPLYNWSTGLDDHLLGVTHVLRGQEHATNETKQRFVYAYFGWEYPTVITLGRFSLQGLVLSKSMIREGIAKGAYSGWDDPRLGTIRAFRRRGWQPEALRNIIIEIGPTSSDSMVALENLAAHNRKIVDKSANRYFFIAEPIRIRVAKPPVRTAKLKLHPEKPKGWRTLKAGSELLIERQDMNLHKGKEVRLMGLCNIMLRKGEPCAATGVEVKPVPKIHWLPARGAIKVTVIMPDKTIKGLGERTLLKAKAGDVVQFERFGFVRIEKKAKSGVTVVFGHK
ncbi:MAG: glutamate--tRNA ligase [Candidatus Aenigmatarchaeota archaeon]